MTAEDEVKGDLLRARQNVIHEIGLFQGRLGFSKAIVLLEEGVEEFSNLNGINHISFGKGGIRETFGDVLAAISAELPAGPSNSV
jgi:predicted nucleotide-binding protein